MRSLNYGPNWPAVAVTAALVPALFLAVAVFFSGTAAAEPRYLSDMSWTSATSGWGPAEKNMSNGEQAAGDGRAITLNGAAFQKGLGVHATSDVRYSLAGAYSTFSAKVGVDDEVGARGSVVFEVWADGAKLYSSGVMNGASTTKDVLLDIRGKNELRLVVTNASDGFDSDHADWADAMVDNSKLPPPSGTDTPNVCAHWQHDQQRATSGANGVVPYGEEIRKAKEMGVDCFAINIISWNSVQIPEINNLWTAAENWNASHPNDKFFMFPRLDIPSGGMGEATIDAIHADHYDSNARLRVDGGRYGDNLPVTGTWHGESTEWVSGDNPQATWKRMQDEWKASGKPAFFMPYFYDQGSGAAALFDRWDGADPNSQSDDVVDALSQWDGFASGDNSINASQVNRAFDVQADARPGMDMMAGCSPVFNRHSGTEQFGNRIIGDFEGFHAWKTCHEGVVQDKPRFLEYITWNDYLEGTTLGGPYTRDQMWPSYRGNELDHTAFRKIGEYYIQKYEGNTPPSKDFIAIAHRPHPENAPGVNPNGAGIADDTDNAQTTNGSPSQAFIRPLVRQSDYSVVEDRLYAAVMLTQPGQVRLTSGTRTQTFDVPAGVTEVSMPFSVGSQKIDLLRGGNVVLSATSARQVVSGPISLFNYNVETTYAEGT